jgi:pimeloyl-ACP methyl ester carboxylesterase
MVFHGSMTPSATAARPDELRALVRLAADELARATGGIGDIHRAIAARAFGSAGAGATPARRIHDGIAGAVYGGLRGATRVAGAGADHALARRGAREGRMVSAAPAGAAAIAALNGLIGDRLEAEGSDLAEPMAIRVDGRAVQPERDALAAAFPDASPRIAVFVHGLMETEYAWRLGAGEHGGYGERLSRDLAITPVEVRYNTGRHISENGRSLHELLEALVAAWPVELEQIALIGHSMGGLVARSAAHQASLEDAACVTRVRHVVSLGSPHTGAPLEQAVHVASAALHALPDTRPWAALLRRRSAGIRDLRGGSLVDEDWQGRDPEALRAAALAEVPLLEGAAHHFVAATVTRSPRHPLGRLVGDVLVLVPSASGRSRRRQIPFRAEDGLELGGAHHLALLCHPQVYEALRGWLG